MATPADPNKQLLTDSQAIEAEQPGYGLTRSQWAKVYHGQDIGGYVLTVENGEVTAVTPPEPDPEP